MYCKPQWRLTEALTAGWEREQIRLCWLWGPTLMRKCKYIIWWIRVKWIAEAGAPPVHFCVQQWEPGTVPPTYWRLASLHLTSYILHLTSYTLDPTQTIHLTIYTLYPTPYSLHLTLTPYIRRTFEHFINILREMCSVLIHVKPIIDRPNSTEKY